MSAVSDVLIRLESGTVALLRFEHGTQVIGGDKVEGSCRVVFDREPSHQDVQDADCLVREALALIGWIDVHLVPQNEAEQLTDEVRTRRN